MAEEIPGYAARLPLRQGSLPSVRARYHDSIRSSGVCAPDLLAALVATRSVWGAPPCRLAVSGGTDSALLALALRDGAFPPTVTLAVSPASRDLLAARRLGESLGFAPAPLIVGEADLLEAIGRHAALLRELPDYTQRILALAELFLCRDAAARGEALVTGHGPESVLGGFHRHHAPSLEDVDGMLDRLLLNVTRLDLVAAASGCAIRLPFLAPSVFAAIVALRRAGGTKEAVIRAARPNLPFAERKSSLQNGSGAHYLFARMARRAEERYVRHYMEKLIHRHCPVPP